MSFFEGIAHAFAIGVRNDCHFGFLDVSIALGIPYREGNLMCAGRQWGNPVDQGGADHRPSVVQNVCVI